MDDVDENSNSYGPLVELPDTADLKSAAEMRAGWNPAGTTKYSRRKKPSKEHLLELVRTSSSVRQLCQRLGLRGGSAHRVVKRWIDSFQLDTSHFTGALWNRGLSLRDTSTMLVANSSLSTAHVKKRVLKEKLLKYECSVCGISDWNGKPLCLELDHTNGISNDHRMENLRLICPNCHSQTETFRGKNIKLLKREIVSDALLIESLVTSPNIRQALLNVGLAAKGGNYARCYRLLSKHAISQGSVAELAYASDSNPDAARLVGSTPTAPTI